MIEPPSDRAARDRFAHDWGVNLAVVANAGSGKTTAISERLAAIAMAPDGAERLRRTAVVTYTKKAAKQIGQGARKALLRRLAAAGGSNVDPLSRLDQAIFGTIHSFCITLARRHGSTLGLHLNPTIIEEDDGAPWEAFIEEDPMQFSSLSTAQVDAFLRHASLDVIFELAADLNLATAQALSRTRVAPLPPAPTQASLDAILDAMPSRKGKATEALLRNKEKAREWASRFNSGKGYLPLPEPEGEAAGIKELYRAFLAPVRSWLADAGGVLAAELSARYRAWRQDRGVQTYADQVDTAVALLSSGPMLEVIRSEGWHVILDEAQDTDRDQFSVLVEITRPPGSTVGAWPGKGGAGPRPGHFCMVGDAQQGIYSARADIRNFQQHVAAFEKGDSGERLTFDVTFRSPRAVIGLLNRTLPDAFGPGHDYNFGLPPKEGATAPFLQVDYEPLVPGPRNLEGGMWRLPLRPPAVLGTQKVSDRIIVDEARQIARILKAGGAAAVGAGAWGDICIIAPRRNWLPIIRGAFEAEGLKTALQMRRNRNGDNPAFAWLSGLMAVLCDPENTFEWVGVLREIFGISDSLIADTLAASKAIEWDEPGDYPPPIASALGVLSPFFGRVDAEGESLGLFASDLARACRLGERARIVDPEGGVVDELERLLAGADELGLTGAGPRAWHRSLLDDLDGLRASGRPSAGAVNLITAHSAKGLEWPVVIPMGIWRKMGRRDNHGLQLVSGRDGGRRLVFETAGMSPDAKTSRNREWMREQVRLLYVLLTRAKESLVIPWSEGCSSETESFGAFWGWDPAILEPVAPRDPSSAQRVPAEGALPVPEIVAGMGSPAGAFPERVLPHQLAKAPDYPRTLLHEASAEAPSPSRDGVDPLDYGIWWHETLEHVPWTGTDDAVAGYEAERMAAASGRAYAERGAAEWARLLSSSPWARMREQRWRALAEVGIFAPLEAGRWIDGVMDLVLHDPKGRDVWIVDWKTNRDLPGETSSALLARLAAEYEGQLRAYGACAAGFFPGCTVRLWVYSTVAGDWTEIPGAS